MEVNNLNQLRGRQDTLIKRNAAFKDEIAALRKAVSYLSPHPGLSSHKEDLENTIRSNQTLIEQNNPKIYNLGNEIRNHPDLKRGGQSTGQYVQA